MFKKTSAPKPAYIAVKDLNGFTYYIPTAK